VLLAFLQHCDTRVAASFETELIVQAQSHRNLFALTIPCFIAKTETVGRCSSGFLLFFATDMIFVLLTTS